MKEKLIKLYNTLCTIETKGENTKTMATCLNYLTNLVLSIEDESGVNQTESTVGD